MRKIKMAEKIREFTLEEYMNLPNDSFELYQRTGSNKIGDIFARSIWKEKVKEGHNPIYMEIISIKDKYGNYKDSTSQCDNKVTGDPGERMPEIKMRFKFGKIKD
jgi:hypothetical protein